MKLKKKLGSKPPDLEVAVLEDLRKVPPPTPARPHAGRATTRASLGPLASPPPSAPLSGGCASRAAPAPAPPAPRPRLRPSRLIRQVLAKNALKLEGLFKEF